MRKAWKCSLAALLLGGCVSMAGGIALVKARITLPRKRVTAAAAIPHTILEDAAILTPDGIQLRAWFIRPQRSNGNVVILLHGVTDNRTGMAGYAQLFTDQGYGVLLPDARAHGESGGEIATYGLREPGMSLFGPIGSWRMNGRVACMVSASRWARRSCSSP
jgi:pimeloyl-ACP methyl ester carboxylesterase